MRPNGLRLFGRPEWATAVAAAAAGVEAVMGSAAMEALVAELSQLWSSGKRECVDLA